MNITIVGLGRIGLVAACCLAKSGHTVTGIEINPEKIKIITAGVSPFYEPEIAELLKSLASTGRLQFAQTLPDCITSEAVMIAVNTPTLPDGSADLAQVQRAVGEVTARIKGPATLIMKSTVPPGTGNDLVRRFLKDRPVSYVSNPEFLRTGHGIYDWYNQSRIVIGADDAGAIREVQALYDCIEAPVVVTDITSAEMIKCASNAFLATKISFGNEMANICEVVGANIDDVTKGMGLDPRISSSFLQAGIGYGGSCLPKDIKALSHLAKDCGYTARLLDSTIQINDERATVVINKLKQSLGKLKRRQIAMLGLSFKAGTDDVTDSPAIRIAQALIKAGAIVKVYDPAGAQNARPHLDTKVTFATDVCSTVDGACTLILTNESMEFIHADFKQLIKKMLAPYILLDCRNVLAMQEMLSIGFNYIGIGRTR